MAIRTSRTAAAIAIALVAAAGCAGAAPPPSPVALEYASLNPLELEVPIGPDWMAGAFESVWVKRDDGHVTRLDPATGAIQAEIDTAVTNGDLCQGLGVGADAVYTCSGQDLVQIDPAMNTVRRSIAAGKIHAQGRLVAHTGSVWVLAGQGDRLVAISESDGTLAGPISLPVACSDLAVGPDGIYVVCPAADRVLRIDPSAGNVAAEAIVSEPSSATVNGAGVWVGTEEGIVRLDPVTLVREATVAGVVPGSFGTVWADADAVYVRRISIFLTRIDAATALVTHTLAVPSEVGPFDGGGDVIGFEGALWTSDAEAGVVVRLDGIPES
jgi:hypothetical protein